MCSKLNLKNTLIIVLLGTGQKRTGDTLARGDTLTRCDTLARGDILARSDTLARDDTLARSHFRTASL